MLKFKNILHNRLTTILYNSNSLYNTFGTEWNSFYLILMIQQYYHSVVSIFKQLACNHHVQNNIWWPYRRVFASSSLLVSVACTYLCSFACSFYTLHYILHNTLHNTLPNTLRKFLQSWCPRRTLNSGSSTCNNFPIQSLFLQPNTKLTTWCCYFDCADSKLKK